MKPVVKVLYILSAEEYGDQSERGLNEVVCTMDERWHLHLIASRPMRYRKIRCRYTFHRAWLICSPIGFKARAFLARAIYLISSLFVGVRAVRKHGIHVVGCLGAHLYLGLIALLIARLTHRRCVVRVNENDVFCLLLALGKSMPRSAIARPILRAVAVVAEAIERFVLKSADIVVTHGPLDYERISKLNERTLWIPLWVDTDKFKPMGGDDVRSLKERLCGPGGKLVLFVGRLHPIKGIRYLFTAFKKVLKRRGDVYLALIGGGDQADKYKQLSRALGIEDKVRFLGYIVHDELPRYYNSADVFVLPSLSEEFSNTILEAMACKVPVVATSVGGNPYLIEDGATGFLVPPRNSDELAKKILFVLENKRAVMDIVERAYRNVMEYNRQAVGEKHKRAILLAINKAQESFHRSN